MQKTPPHECEFQFQTGSIKSIPTKLIASVFRSFNSKLVRLKAMNMSRLHEMENRFNSKLVRLKADVWTTRSDNPTTFQFQTGSIKSQGYQTALNDLVLRFNSKLVRLKVTAPYSGLTTEKFQFQTGSIKRLTKKMREMDDLLSFNSKLVRLKETRHSHRMAVVWYVSIPNWFD